MPGFSITQEALLATEELAKKTAKAEASTPQVYKKFVQLSEQQAIDDRKENAEEQSEESGAGGLEESEGASEVPEGSEASLQENPPAESTENPPTEAPSDSTADESKPEESGEKPEDSDALADSIDQAPQPAMESLTEWIKDKTQFSDSSIVRNVGALAAGLTHIGITYGPALINYMFKGMIWTFSRLGTALYTGTQSLSNHIEKSNNSISKLEARLNDAEETIISQLNEGRQVPEFTFKNQKAIDFMKIGQNLDFSSNLRSFAGNLVKATESIASEFESGVAIVERIASSDSKGRINSLHSVMDVAVPRGGFTKGSVAGYESKDDLIQQFHTEPIWPGDACLLFNRPIPNSDDLSVITDAYGKADMFVALAKNGMGPVSSVGSLNGAQAVIMAKSVRILLASMKEVNKNQEKMKNLAPKLGLKAKQLFMSLADDKAKVSMKDSMVEPLYLRSALAATVFTNGSTSALTHASRVAASAITFIEAHASKIATSTD